MSVVQPATVAEASEAIRLAKRVKLCGAKTKSGLSGVGPAGVDCVLDCRAINGIVEYEPTEYTITALAGTRLSTLSETLAAEGQYLPFDPPFVRAGTPWAARWRPA